MSKIVDNMSKTVDNMQYSPGDILTHCDLNGKRHIGLIVKIQSNSVHVFWYTTFYNGCSIEAAYMIDALKYYIRNKEFIYTPIKPASRPSL